jgi:hypothetical protein
VLTLLAETPTRIGARTTGLAPADVHTSPNRDAWSANQVLAHLRACADVWGDAIATIIAADRPTLQAVSPRTWIKQTDYLEQEFPSSLGAFTAQRSHLLAILEPLPPEGWSRTATVLGAGRPREWTVLSYAQRLASHEHAHIKQIERIVTTVRNMAR